MSFFQSRTTANRKNDTPSMTMDRYTVGKKLGEGAFGVVFLGVEKATGVERAVKTLRGSYSWDVARKMRELQSVLSLPKHRNIVHLYEFHRDVDGTVHFILEYMQQGSLHELVEHREKQNLGPVSNSEAKFLLHQLLLGVHHLHQHGIMHRDLKPDNVLLTTENGQLVCKVADFSIARHQSEDAPITSYISTRWYRAPEILLGAAKYSFVIDTWAIGCIAYELYKNTTLFPGHDETDQLRLIFACLGTPESVGWKAGAQLLRKFDIDSWPTLPSPAKVLQHQSKLSHDNAQVLDFLRELLELDPIRRLTTASALQHELFCGNDVNDNAPKVKNESPGVSSYTTPSGADVQQRSNHLVTISPRPTDDTSTSIPPDTSQVVVAAARQSSETRPSEIKTASHDASVNPYLLRKSRK